MPRKPIDLDAVRRAEAKVAGALSQYPELGAPNPEREAALGEFLPTLDTEEADDAANAHRPAPRPAQDQGL